jgi:hypothetical protein
MYNAVCWQSKIVVIRKTHHLFSAEEEDPTPPGGKGVG